MVSSFAKGDLVYLKSGGPTMTVIDVSDDAMKLARYHDDKLVTESICPEALVSVTEVPQTKPLLVICVEGAPALELTSGGEIISVDWPLALMPEVPALIKHALRIVEDEIGFVGDVPPEAVAPIQRNDAEELGRAVLSQLPAASQYGKGAR